MPDHESQPERARLEDPGDSGSDGFTPPEPPGTADAVTQLLDEFTHETQPQPLLDATNLRGQVALVTGGSSGIGRAVALEMAQCGAHVAFCFKELGMMVTVNQRLDFDQIEIIASEFDFEAEREAEYSPESVIAPTAM